MVRKLLQPSLARLNAPVKGSVAVGCFESEQPPVEGLEEATARQVLAAVSTRRWAAEPDKQLRLSTENDTASIALHGLGKREAFDATRLRRWLDQVSENCAAESSADLLLVPPHHPWLASAEGASALLRQLSLMSYSFDDYRQASGRELRRLRLLPPEACETVYRASRKEAAAVADGIALTRHLANTPPNRATPAWMASQARSLARRTGAKVRVLGPKELKRLKMGALLAVGQASANTPRFVRLEIGNRGPVIALVGKGITFDTGGVSIKPGAAMDEMKYDKAGACTVLGIVEAVAALDLPVRLRAYLALAENMVGSRAYRPGDIVTTRSGKTVEVLNTDAEGRLVLADAFALAFEEQPDALVEFSTLTGATVVALGHHGAALYTPDDDMADSLLGAAADAGERLWRMPLWPEFGEEMKGRHADLKNLGIRWGGANSAAAFLAEFTGDHPSWAHVDIAGTAWVPGDQGQRFGATGYGVASTVNWLVRRGAAS